MPDLTFSSDIELLVQALRETGKPANMALAGRLEELAQERDRQEEALREDAMQAYYEGIYDDKL